MFFLLLWFLLLVEPLMAMFLLSASSPCFPSLIASFSHCLIVSFLFSKRCFRCVTIFIPHFCTTAENLKSELLEGNATLNSGTPIPGKLMVRGSHY